MAEEELKSCEVCGATIYPEHISSGKAAFLAGQLMCPVCLNEKKSAASSEPSADQQAEERVALVDEGELDSSRVIQAIGAGGMAAVGAFDDSKLTRALNKTEQGATRVRVFHTKMNDGAATFMTETINTWIDGNPDIEVKFVQSTVGVWEGKHAEPHLILTVWY